MNKRNAISPAPEGSGCLLLEALALLSLAQLAVVLLPFRWVAKVFGKHRAERTECDNPGYVAQRISWAVETAVGLIPWNCKCLVCVVACKVMLARRGITSTVYIGVNKDAQGELHAHAWLRSGNLYLTGGQGHKQFKVITTFAELG